MNGTPGLQTAANGAAADPVPPKAAAPARPYLWSFVQHGSEQLLLFGVSVVLARLLEPSHFGAIAMVTAFTGFAGILLDLGLGTALIHKEEPSPQDLATAFWTNLAVGAACSAALVLAAPLLARFYEQPELATLTRVLAPTFVLGAIPMVDAALLRKALDMRSLARASVLSSALAGAIGVTLAACGWGALALAAQTVARALFNALLLRRASGFRPSWCFSRASLRSLLNYGAGIVGANTINYWTRNADNLLIGKWMGSSELGVYNRAYALMSLPMNSISRVVSSVLFPVLAAQRGDAERLREEFLRTACRVAFVTFPMMVGMGCCARPFIETMYGPRWEEAIWILQAFVPLGIYQTIVGLYGPIYLALGATTLDFKWSLVLESVLIAGIVGGLLSGHGIPGLIAGLYVGVLINFFPTNLIPLRLLGLPLTKLIAALLPTFVASCAMGAVVIAADRCLPALAPAAALAIEVALGVVSYAAACAALRIDGFASLVAFLRRGQSPR